MTVRKMVVHAVILAAFSSVSLACPLILQTSVQVERQLLGKGFHSGKRGPDDDDDDFMCDRELETTLLISSVEEVETCWVLVKETLPQGAYVDPNRLAFNRPLGGPDFHVPQTVNVEAPEHLSPRIVAYFYTFVTELQPDGRWLANITVPVHFRYHRARSGESFSLEAEVKVPHPAISLLCEGSAAMAGEACSPLAQLEPCPPSGNQLCEFLPIHSYSTSEGVSGVVPVGNTDLLDTVLLATTCLTAAATLLLLTTLSRTPPSPHPAH